MTSTLFSVFNTFALLCWLPLWMAPKSKLTEILIHRHLAVLVLSLSYAALLLPELGGFDPKSFSSLEGVVRLFQSEAMVLVGWIHYLAFDLFVGGYLAREGARLGIRHAWMIPVLAFTFMFGPVGFVLFQGVRLIHKREQQ